MALSDVQSNLQDLIMRIAIAQRLRPFSHIPGTTCVVPGSIYCVQILTRLFAPLFNVQISTGIA